MSDTGAIMEGIEYVRRMTNERDQSHYVDDAVQQLIDHYGEIGAIVSIWRDKTARYSALADVTDSGTSRRMSQLYDQAMKQLSYWEGVLKKFGSGAGTAGGTRVAKIIRSDYDAG